jgi:hypothetical protein
VLEQIASADVDDEGDARPDGSDVREILIGSHAHVHAAGARGLPKLREHVLIRVLVADEVLRPKRPGRFG